MMIDKLSDGAEDFTGNIWRMRNGETVLIDVGTGDSWEAIKRLGEVDKVVVTHSHYDHVDNLPKVKDMFDPEIYAYEPDNLPVEAERIQDGDQLTLCGSDFRVIHTPGHREDSICLYGSGVLFAGDLLFPEGGFGRTDLDGADRDKLIESIEKIAALDVEEMYCGHEDAAKTDVNEQIQVSLEEAEKHEPKY